MSAPALDILAIPAHRDDGEQTLDGTRLKMVEGGVVNDISMVPVKSI